MKQIQGSVRVKLRNTFMRGPSFFSIHFSSFLISLPQLKRFYYFTSLNGLQDVENHCDPLREKTGRKIPYLRFRHVLFPI